MAYKSSWYQKKVIQLYKLTCNMCRIGNMQQSQMFNSSSIEHSTYLESRKKYSCLLINANNEIEHRYKYQTY